MIKAVENIFGGEPTLGAWDGGSQYVAFTDGGGGGGGYTPPVPPNPTYLPSFPIKEITQSGIKINLLSNNGEVVEFTEDGNSLAYGVSNIVSYTPASVFNGPKTYKVNPSNNLIANQYYVVSITKKYDPIYTPTYDYSIKETITGPRIRETGQLFTFDSYQNFGLNFGLDSYKNSNIFNWNFNITPKVTAIDYKYSEVIRIEEYTLTPRFEYTLSDTKILDSSTGVVNLNFTFTKKVEEIRDEPPPPDEIRNTLVEYEILFSSNLKNELGKNVILDYKLFQSDGIIIEENSILLEDGNDIKQVPLANLNGRIDFQIRYNELPSGYTLTNIYQTTNTKALEGISTPDYSKWNSQNSSFSLDASQLKSGISVVVLFEKEIQVARPTIYINDVYKQIGVQVKESDTEREIIIPFETSNTDEVVVYIDGKGAYKTIPAIDKQIVLYFQKDFDEVYGTKKVVLLSKSGIYGTGDSVTTLITFTAVNDFPSITEINYPQNIDVPSFSDFNIDYKIQYASFSATTIDVDLLLSDKTRTPLFKNLNPNGDISINLKKLRENNPNWSPNGGITLVFKPFNRSGSEELIGNEYEITTTLGLPAFAFDENIFSTAIFESFVERLNVIEPEKESKYLTHLINFGNDEQVLVSSWENDDWTLSEKEEDELGNIKIKNKIDSIILKLYSPLDGNISENTTLWVTKLMANPLIETVVLTEQDDVKCPPIKGPNFSVNVDFVSGQSTNFESLDNLILSGSTSSTQLISTYLTSSLVNTEDLNIEYVSGSKYLWNNFVHFSSAKERVINFDYKIKLIEQYENLILSASTDYTNGGSAFYTSSIASRQEIDRQTSKKENLIAGFDGFEKFLFESSSMGWPYNGANRRLSSETQVTNWYNNIVDLAETFDIENQNYVLNNIPEYIVNNTDNDQFILFFTMIGQHFDNIYFYTKSIEKSRGLGYKAKDGVSDRLLFDLLKSFNWDAKNLAADSKLWEYAFGVDIDGNVTNENPAKKRTNEVWRRIINNLPYLLKHKGTRRGIYALLSCYGIPSSNLSILEFGGPEVSEVSKTKLVFDNLTYGLKMQNGSYLSIDWPTTDKNRKPDTIEFFVKPAEAGDYNILSGSEWGIHLSGSANQKYGKVIFNYSGSNALTSSLLPIFNGDYFGVAVSRELNTNNNTDYHNFELNVRQANKEATIFQESNVLNDISASDSRWGNGYTIYFGNDFTGSVDEFRLWSTPLDKERFYEHVSFPEMVNGNHISSSTDDLYFRLDFEYPKNLAVYNTILNVDTNIYFSGSADRVNYESGSATELYSLNPSASYSASAYGFTSVLTHPFQFETIDRTVVLEIPDVGSTRYSTNKVRFESQELVSDLSSKSRATKKAFDQSPTDSNRVGLFFSPTKELNIDIAKSFGGLNLDNYIGDPSDRYKDSYRNLDKLRNYYFKRFDGRDIYAYINLIKLYEKSMFEDIKKMLPARVKATTGLLIEPHILERSKHQYTKPVAEHNDYESVIEYGNELLSAEILHKEFELDTRDVYSLFGENNQYDANIESASVATMMGDSFQKESTIEGNDTIGLNGESFYREAYIDAGLDKSSIVTEIELTNSNIVVGQNDYDVLGFGIYAQSGSAIRTYYNKDGKKVKERVRVQLVKETKTREYVYLTGSVGVSGLYNKVGTETYTETKLNIQPFSGSSQFTSSLDTVEVTPLNGYLPTHYRYTSDLTRGLQNSFYKGCKNTSATTLDGSSPVETFLTNPNTLRVNKAGRDASEPILEVE